MKFTSFEQTGIGILSIEGEFDLSETTAVDDWFDQQLGQPITQMVVDMSRVSFIDSAGLSSLVYGMKQARAVGGDIYLCGLPAEVRMVFELTRLDEVFHIFADQAEAILAFTQKTEEHVA